MSRVELLRALDRPVRRWKNGCGDTAEIACFPPGANLEDFDWRLSMATVAQAGPFSLFEGVYRLIAILDGCLHLAFDQDGRTEALTASSEPYRFAGDAALVGTPVGGNVRDLNLMVRRGTWEGTMARVAAPCRLRLAAPTTFILFTQAGLWHHGDITVPVTPLDAARIDAAEGKTISLQSDGSIYVIGISPAGQHP